ncbi:type II toxin-antitoxin system Phd/YefM family antitoxin [Deinococcus sp. SM5_A1]|uniref:type II toxin-antitoxin system Phd/YefM family antitoxin n=1 Tax=Deinococcus sp. SM5_A1 TaxID=3379094 RepID=UPI0038599311
MQTINLYDAKNRFSKLVDAAEEGEVIIIARNGKPAVKLVPLDYGERSTWSNALQTFIQRGLQSGQYDEHAFEIDRSDVLPMPECDLR